MPAVTLVVALSSVAPRLRWFRHFSLVIVFMLALCVIFPLYYGELFTPSWCMALIIAALLASDRAELIIGSYLFGGVGLFTANLVCFSNYSLTENYPGVYQTFYWVYLALGLILAALAIFDIIGALGRTRTVHPYPRTR